MSSTNATSNSAEQPQTKRQKIEKTKAIGKNSKSTKSISNTANNSPSPEVIEPTESTGNKYLCSSLSSSDRSISVSSSSNNSPQSTPPTSRATSLTHLLSNPAVANSLSAEVVVTDANSLTSTEVLKPACNNTNRYNSNQTDDEVDHMPLTQILPVTVKSMKFLSSQRICGTDDLSATEEMRHFEESLSKQCLCGVSERILRKPFESHYSVDANGQQRIANLNEWSTGKLLQCLSNLQLLFDIYLKQNEKGSICARIIDVCDALIRNDHDFIDEIILLAGCNNSYIQYLACRALASFFVIAKQENIDVWLEKLLSNLFSPDRLDENAMNKIRFSLEIMKRLVGWKDRDSHPLEDKFNDTPGNVLDSTEAVGSGASGSNNRGYVHFQTHHPTLETNYFAVHFQSEEYTDANNYYRETDPFQGQSNSNQYRLQHGSHINNSTNPTLPTATINDISKSTHQVDNSNLHLASYVFNETDKFYNPATSFGPVCRPVTLTDSESFDTIDLKSKTVRTLENIWPELVKDMSSLMTNHSESENVENCILSFLQLWGNIISVKTNLSVEITLPFHAQLERFELLLFQNLPCTIYRQMLCLFNEALCYATTLALQDILPQETCRLAHQIVRHVKDYRILESLPRQQPENVVSMIGYKRRPVNYVDGSLQPQYEEEQSVNNLTGQMDKTILQKMALLVLKSIAVIVKDVRCDSSDSSIDSTDYDAFQDMVVIQRSIRDVLRRLDSFIKRTLEFHPECHFSTIIIRLFEDQDDYLIEAMICTLDATNVITVGNNAFPELASMLNPVYTFLEYLKVISNGYDVLLELLMNNAPFLLYMLKFLKYVRSNWALFVQSCLDFGAGDSPLDEAMSVLIRLRLKISRLMSMFVYDISPVLRLLEICENLYEGDELS